MLRMQPVPPAKKQGRTAWVSRVRAVMLTAIVSSIVWELSLANGLKFPLPALLMRAVIAGSLKRCAPRRARSAALTLKDHGLSNQSLPTQPPKSRQNCGAVKTRNPPTRE